MTGVPAWLQPPKVVDTTQEYNEWTWEEILTRVSEGQLLRHICNDTTMPPDAGRLMRWIMKDPKRKERYYEAQDASAELLAEDAYRAAEGKDKNGEYNMDDTQRSTLKVNTLKWMAGVRNRARFGDIKQVEQKVTLDISEAMSKAQERVVNLRNTVLIENDEQKVIDSE